MTKSKEFWDNHWKKDKVVYNARFSADNKTRISIDVRDFIWSKSTVLEDLVNEIIDTKKSETTNVLKICSWTQDNIKYTSDKTSSNTNEFWQFPTETIALRRGDCEDMSILIVSLLRVYGVDAYKIKVAAGLVETGKNAELGGHAYPVYLREMDEEWVVLDPCYYPNKLCVNKRPIHKNMSKYKDIWFTFNDEYSWAQKSFEINKSIK